VYFKGATGFESGGRFLFSIVEQDIYVNTVGETDGWNNFYIISYSLVKIVLSLWFLQWIFAISYIMYTKDNKTKSNQDQLENREKPKPLLVFQLSRIEATWNKCDLGDYNREKWI
jgi:hypothetical protein